MELITHDGCDVTRFENNERVVKEGVERERRLGEGGEGKMAGEGGRGMRGGG